MVADSREVVSAKKGSHWRQWACRVTGRSFWVNVLNKGHWNFWAASFTINREHLWVVAARLLV